MTLLFCALAKIGELIRLVTTSNRIVYPIILLYFFSFLDKRLRFILVQALPLMIFKNIFFNKVSGIDLARLCIRRIEC